MGLAVVDEFGAHLEDAWRSASNDGPTFSELAAAHLQSAHLHERLDPAEIVSWVFGGSIPRQVDPGARFGQPPVTLFRSPRFYVSALFWVDGTTTIHDHGFSGAFQVLAGSSIESRFGFQPSHDLGGHLKLGELTVQGSKLLGRGDVCAVPAGPAYIHSLFHLARPSISLVVRTFGDEKTGAQFNYSPAGTAFDTYVVDEALDRTLQLVDLLRKVDDPSFEEKVGRLIERADPYAAFKIVMACAGIKDRALVGRLVERVRDEMAAATFHDYVQKIERTNFIIQRRRDVQDPELRFVLAVLLNAHRREDCLSLVSAHIRGCEPSRQIAALLRRLSRVTVRLQVGTNSWEPSLLGVPSFDDRLEAALTDFLRQRERSYTAEEQSFIAKLRAIPALSPLFTD